MKFKPTFLQAALVAGAIALSACLVALLVIGDRAFKKRALDEQADAVRNSEAVILDAERRLEDGRSLDAVKNRLLKMNESILSNNQMRRRLLALGDIFQLDYKSDIDDPNREATYELALRSYERAAEFCKAPGQESERNEILRRIAELYVDKGNFAKALEQIEKSKSSQTLPADRWRFRMIEGQCKLRDKKPYEAAAAFGSVADECEDRALWGEAMVSKGKSILAAASDDALLKAYMSQDGKKILPEDAYAPAALEKERKMLMANAAADFEKTLTKTSVLDRATAEAKLGLLRICVLRRDKSGAYEMVNNIRSSPMLMRDKAEALLSLAKLHESLGEYKNAIKLLETCAQDYPISAIFVPVSLSLYDYYKKADNWEKAFAVAEKLVMRGADNATIIKIINDFSPGNSDMLDLIRSNEARDQYIARLQAMLDKLKSTRPELWKSIQHQANLILCTVLYISGKYPQAEKAILGSFEVPLLPKANSDELMHLDLECAVKAHESPAIVIVRAKRYLQKHPVGKYYQDALAAMLDAYYEMGLYNDALDVSKRMYMDALIRRSDDGKASKYWAKTVSRIGECYAKLGELDKANQVLRDNAKAVLASPDSANAFMDWASIAEKRGQAFEAMRRLDVLIPLVSDPSDRARLIVARYLLQLKSGNNKDFAATFDLLDKITASSKLNKGLALTLRRELYVGLLEYAFRAKPDAIPQLLDNAVSEFKGESWPQYWTLRWLSSLYGKDSLEDLKGKYEKSLKEGGAFNGSGKQAPAEFINRQLSLISGLLAIDDKVSKLKTERGL